ncbi:NDUC2 dehydrogenase, partial [Dromaius novaehollandiae]|nr:NDUC2 dehydrogenase [Dromaius novaehollandiae]
VFLLMLNDCFGFYRHNPGVHRQILFTTVGWFVGYFLTKHTEYIHAKRDRELFEYVKQHPEDFKATEKKRIGELLEDFHPVR